MWSRCRPYVFTLAPLAVTVAFAAIEGVLYHANCGPLRTLAMIFGRSGGPTACKTITLSADLPSLALGCSATMAAWLYRQSEVRWRDMGAALTETNVLRPGYEHLFLPGTRVERVLEWLVASKLGRSLTGLMVAVGGVVFYVITYEGAFLFRDYARNQHLGPQGYEQVRAHWWANSSQHPLLAAAWIFVGGVGVYAAALDLTAFLRRALVLRRLRESDYWRFVPSRGRVRHPWEPLMRLANIRVWGFVTFLVTLAVLIYLARAPQPGGARNLALAGLAIGVLAITMVPLRLYLQAVVDAYELTSQREVDAADLADGSADQNDYAKRTYFLLRRAEVSLVSVPPSLSSFKSVTRALVILTALAGFVASVYQVIGV